MTSRALSKALPRCVVPRRFYHGTSIQKGGAFPPLAPFARNPLKAAPLVENTDALWDDGVAPELALDFDMPNTSSSEALATWVGGLTAFAVLYNGIGLATNWGKDNNPALPSSADVIYPDHTRVKADQE